MAGAIAGIIGGFGIAIFYLVVTRSLPAYAVSCFGVSLPTNPAPGVSPVDLAKAMAVPNAMRACVAASHPVANRAGWFGIARTAASCFGSGFWGTVILILPAIGNFLQIGL